MSSRHRRLTLAAACFGAAFSIATSATPADASALSACSAHRGTIVAVDFEHWGGPIVRGCGIGQRSGYALLHAAGFTTAGDEHDGPGFVCRLGNNAFRGGTQYPRPSQDPCIVTPPASADWSFWLAPAGQNKWTYSPLGAMGTVPKAGEIELWTFGATNISGTRGSGVPKFAPGTVRAASAGAGTAGTTSTTTTTTTPTTTTTTTTQSTTSTTTGRSTTTTPRSLSRRRAHPHKHRRRRASVAKHTKATKPARHRDAPAIVPARPTSLHASSGSPLPLVIGICLALALAAGAGWTAWRRRRLA